MVLTNYKITVHPLKKPAKDHNTMAYMLWKWVQGAKEEWKRESSEQVCELGLVRRTWVCKRGK